MNASKSSEKNGRTRPTKRSRTPRTIKRKTLSRWFVSLVLRSAAYGVVQPPFTPSMKARVRKQFGSRCARCGKGPRGLQFDHHLPLCLGYPLVYGNAVLLCGPCNRSKSVKLPSAFYTRTELTAINRLLREQKTWARGVV